MAKKEKNSVYTEIYKDAVTIRGVNRNIQIIKVKPKGEFYAPNVIHIKALAAEAGTKPGVKHSLSKNKKIKYSGMGLSDQALIELYMGLGHYVKRIINNQTK
jgi:hypothetical protein